SFTVINSPLTEITRVEVPFFYKLSTDSHSYELSSNHPVFVLSKHGITWKTAPLLDISNDYIITSVIEKLEPPEIEFRSEKINSPARFSNELSYLVGLIAGDGYVGKDNLTFTGKDEELHERFKSLLRKIFKINKFSTYKDKNGNIRTIVYSTEIVRFFRAIGFKVGKKNYKEFLEKFLIRFDQRLLVAFLLGLLHTDGTQRKYSIIIYSSDRDALEKIKKISFSRGLNFKGPLEHQTRWSKVYKLVLRGRYNLLTFKHIADTVGFGTLKISIPKRSYEYVPKSLMKIIKMIFLKHKIRYGSDWKSEPYINARKKPTLATLERLLKHLKNYRERFNEEEKSFLNFVEKLVERKLMLDPVREVERIDSKKTLYDIGTVTGNFVTAYGHVMHNSKWYGESLPYDEEILVLENGIPKRMSIGEVVDDSLSSDGASLKVAAFDENGKVKFSPVKDFIKHGIRKSLLKITTSSGREIRVTDDHSLFVLEGGKVKAIKSSELKEGESFIAIPAKLPFVETVSIINF
ncbi:MAG TPA: hypothetical protein ENG34_01075, partial [Candidatus Aenigmarchaeota archaeon]|nr:hypothetical protein [Candidatus Aenigmarchaeota archaeon]